MRILEDYYFLYLLAMCANPELKKNPKNMMMKEKQINKSESLMRGGLTSNLLDSNIPNYPNERQGKK